MLVGVVGNSDTYDSDYRLKGFYGDNKLNMNHPIKVLGNAAQQEWYYYWFVITDNVAESNKDAPFSYHVAVGTAPGGNPDVYVSLMDGRFPTETDYDLSSKQRGSETVIIDSSDRLFKEKGWNTRAGVMVVVGVKVNGKADFSIIANRPPLSGGPLLNM